MKKIGKYYHTLRHTKFKQLLYRLIFRLKERTAYSWLRYVNYEESFHPLSFTSWELVNGSDKYLGGNRFRFLNIDRSFETKINWYYEGRNKLWNLNLQYFDYLLDPSVEREEKIRLVEEYCQEIKSGKIWLESYPISLRLVNWILFASEQNYSSVAFLYCLQLQTKFLRYNQEYHILANHYLENILALTISAHAFRDISLLDYSLERLHRELNEEILDDGGHFECTPMYHSIILSRLLILIDIFQNNSWSGRNYAFLEEFAAKMTGWLKQYAFNNGAVAHFNDSTDNIAPVPSKIYNASARLRLSNVVLPLKSSGYRKFVNSRAEIIIDVGNITPKYQPGHAHSDMLSFCMNIDDVPVFIDPGISTYEVGVQRTKERSTWFHNTVCINGMNQSHVWGAFRVAKRAKITVLSDSNNSLSASHDGYEEKLGVIHKRQFHLEHGKFSIQDNICGKSKIKLQSIAYFYFDSNIKVKRGIDNKFILNDVINITFSKRAVVKSENVEIPAGYNLYRLSTRIAAEFKGSLETEVSF